MSTATFKFLNCTITDKIAHLELNRPDKANALSLTMWHEIRDAFHALNKNTEVRVVVLSGKGKHFCAGIDLQDFSKVMSDEIECEGRKREKIRQIILELQEAFNAIEKCRVPVIAAVHGSCIGAGIDMITACDMRYSTTQANFIVKEIDIGMTADVGTLQRLPHLIGRGMTNELCLTGRPFNGVEAQQLGFVNRAFEEEETLQAHVKHVATAIATKAPLAVRGVKEMLLYSRDHSVADSLNYVATWNAAMLLSMDLVEANQSAMERREPKFLD